MAVRVPLDSTLTAEQALLALRDDAYPFALVGAWAGGGAVVGSEPVAVASPDADPFALLDELPPAVGGADGAFGGGWVGYLGYGLGARVERLPPPPPRPVPVAPFWFGFYDHVLRLDRAGRWWFEAIGSDDRLELLRERLLRPPPVPRSFACSPFVPRPGRAAHARAVSWCKEYIAAGDLYQANLCTRFESRIEGSGVDLFAAACARLRPDYAAYLSCDGGSEIASLSPELFLRRRGREVVTRPIKGTAPRSRRAELAASEKDRAENVMIVDLMRNDLGRTCEVGSVRVEEVARPEPHTGVWHLVSEVRGRLPSGVGDAALVRAAFPPGSVTGAPKIKAMEVISTLESTAREAYTGAIGFASPLAGLELSVAIRTFELRGSSLWLGAGGGIVADSDPDAEYDEVLDKARPLVEALGASLAPPAFDGATSLAPTRAARPDPSRGVFETMLLSDGRLLDRDAHMRRLGVEVYIDLAAMPDPARVRVTLAHDGRVSVESEALAPGAVLPVEVVSLRPLVLPGGLGARKWVDRRVLAGEGEALIVDLTGEVLEAGAGAIVVVEGERLVTPPADGRILPSVTLAALRASLEVAEEPLTLDRLRAADEILVVSSIRRVQRARLSR